MSLQMMIQEVQILSLEERKQLMHILLDMIIEPVQSETELSQRSLLDFYGLGSHAYDGTDAQEYVNQLRREWDEIR
ncbi:MAG: hypothetical protein SH821_17035 [Phototrophicales bacterium]|nr:hypothetical protein [Phototrophicales bacterium]